MSKLKFYTLDDLNKMLKISKYSLYNHIRNGRLVGNKVGNKWMFTEQQVKDYVEGKNKPNK